VAACRTFRLRYEQRVANEAKLHIERQGAGPALVLAHGFGGSARNFRPQARAFAQRVQTTLYDARGHARSEAPSDVAAYTATALKDDFGRVALETGAASIVAGGLSLGAYTALLYALQEPSRVRGLILAAFPSPGAPPRRRWALGFADAIEQRGLEAAGAEYVWDEASRFDPKAAALIRQGFLEHNPTALASILRQVLADLPEPGLLKQQLAALAIPTLVVVGSEDAESLAPCQALAELIPNAELVIVPGAGHVVNLADPTRFNQALASFFDKILL